MSFTGDQNGIIDRYFKEKEGWRSHLEKSKQYIINFIEDKSGTLAVFGSGWLLDLPIEELSRKFNTIYLVDIIQPPQIKHLLK